MDSEQPRKRRPGTNPGTGTAYVPKQLPTVAPCTLPGTGIVPRCPSASRPPSKSSCAAAPSWETTAETVSELGDGCGYGDGRVSPHSSWETGGWAAACDAQPVQGCLTHENPPPRRTLQ